MQTRRQLRAYLVSFAALLLCASMATAAAPQRHIVYVDAHPIAVWSRAPVAPKRAILLIHGRTWSALPDFDLQAPSAERSVMRSLERAGYAVYAVDLRGYGTTPRNANGWTTPNESARDVAEVLRFISQRHPRLPKPALLGWSNGALVAQLTGQHYADALGALILYGYPRDPGAPPTLATSPSEPARETNTRARALSDFISPQVTSPEVVEAFVAAALKADPIRADWNRLEEFLALDPSRVHTPTLVIRGERDPLAPIAAQARLFTGLATRDKQWVDLPGADHAAMLEDTHDAFIAAVRAFIERPQKK